MKLRAAAAELVEQGRALGRAEALDTVAQRMLDLSGLPESELRRRQSALRDDLSRRAEEHRAAAAAAKRRAEALLRAAEHPGARLAIRLVAAARAARQAWENGR